MSTAFLVRAHILRQAVGHIFVRREFLNYGEQGAVDQALYRLKKAGIISSYMRGVYHRTGGKQIPSYLDAIIAKITAFGRSHAVTAKQEASDSKLSFISDKPFTYEVDGASSRFTVFPSAETDGFFVKLKGRPARKKRLENTAAGKTIKALWGLGKTDCTLRVVLRVLRMFGKAEREEFLSSHRWMPGWMSDLVHYIKRADWSTLSNAA